MTRPVTSKYIGRLTTAELCWSLDDTDGAILLLLEVIGEMADEIEELTKA
jgi:hypothetical protein